MRVRMAQVIMTNADSGYILKVEPTGFPDELSMTCKHVHEYTSI
jgi:hypothetical protein